MLFRATFHQWRMKSFMFYFRNIKKFLSGSCNVCTSCLLYTLKTLVLATHKFVFSGTQHFCHIWKTHTCVDSTQVLVLEKSTQVLCDTCSNTTKTSCRQREANARTHAPQAGVLSTELWLSRLMTTLLSY